MFPVRLRKRLMDLAYPAWFMWCASSLLDERLAVDSVKDYCLHFRHFFNDIARTFLADATLLESSVRHQIRSARSGMGPMLGLSVPNARTPRRPR